LRAPASWAHTGGVSRGQVRLDRLEQVAEVHADVLPYLAGRHAVPDGGLDLVQDLDRRAGEAEASTEEEASADGSGCAVRVVPGRAGGRSRALTA